MSAELLKISTENICEGCPKLRALEARHSELNPLRCSDRTNMESIAQDISLLNELAGMYGCTNRDRQIANLGTPVPSFREDPSSWIAFAASCLVNQQDREQVV